MLSVQNLTCNIAGKTILDSVDLQVSAGQHVGLVGRNGSGKSTLFKAILGEIEPDGGKIKIDSGIKVMTVRQDLPSGDISAREFILSQDEERLTFLDKLENNCEGEDISEIYDRLIQIDAFGAEARAAVILRGLGFSEEQQNLPLSTFSGGYRMRIALGAALYNEPDLLLLDEPTNHLDLETTDWLQNFLKSYQKAFILISHERDFLNSTVDYIAHLKNKTVKKYTGNFETFLEIYTNNQKNAKLYNAKMEEKRAHMMEYINRFGAKATKAKQAQSKLKAIEKMKFIPIEPDDPTVSFDFPEPTELPSPIITYNKISLGYGDKIVLKNVSGTIMHDDKIAIVGENGNGKTTFAKFLSGELRQKKGTIEKSNKLKIGYYRQDIFEKLAGDLPVIEYFADQNLPENEIRNHLGRFGIRGDMVFQKIKELSGGEKARLVFSMMTISAPNLLILDEPTNHLDLEMRESLINTLTEYKGAVLIISHDRNFLNRIANSIIVVKNNTITHFNGDLAQYERESTDSRQNIKKR